MDEYKEKVDDVKDKIMNKAASIDQKGKFFTFSKPFINLIDGKSFITKYTSYLYVLVGIFLLWKAIQAGIHTMFDSEDHPGSIFDAEFTIMINWLIGYAAVLLSFWIIFQLFFDRRNQLSTHDNSKGYSAVSVVSNFIRTTGEAIGTYFAIVGTVVAVLALLFTTGDEELIAAAGFWGEDKIAYMQLILNTENYSAGFGMLIDPMGIPLLDMNPVSLLSIEIGKWTAILLYPIAGFLYMLGFRFVSEMINVLADIAKNTNK